MGPAYSPLPSCHSGTSDWLWTPDAQRPRFSSLERKYRPKHSYRCYSLGGALGRLQAPSGPTFLGPTAYEPRCRPRPAWPRSPPRCEDETASSAGSGCVVAWSFPLVAYLIRLMTLSRSIAKTRSINPRLGSCDPLREGQQEAFSRALTPLVLLR